MRGPKPTPITLSPMQRAVLQRLARRHTTSQQLVKRVRIILEADSGAGNWDIARQLGTDRGTVGVWRKRWVEAAPRLEAAQQAGTDERELLALVEEVLADQPRSGAPATFTSEQIVGKVALSCEDPASSGRPKAHWTPRELAAEAIKRGIVGSISPTSVGPKSAAGGLGRGGSETTSGQVLAQ